MMRAGSRHAAHTVVKSCLNTRGFAFVLFEGPLAPVDWSVREARGSRKDARCLARVSAILDQYLPDVLVVSPSVERRVTFNVRDCNLIQHSFRAILGDRLKSVEVEGGARIRIIERTGSLYSPMF